MTDIKIGLVLGSGAARGWAHLGVLNALEQIGVEPDVIVGCSIGAMIGAAKASGQHSQMQEWALSMDPWRIFKLIDVGMSKGGIVGGEKLFQHFASLIAGKKLSDCTIPFGAVATELYSGREIWLQDGALVDAVRASCAMPGMLAPHYYQDNWLIDGAVVNPVPVSLARAMGATHVIAVDLTNEPQKLTKPSPTEDTLEPLQNKHGQEQEFSDLLGVGKQFVTQLVDKFQNNNEIETPSLIGVVAGAVDIMQNRITRARLAGDPPDLLIQPQVSHIGILEFNKAQELIEIGYQAGQQVAHNIERWKQRS